MTIGEAVKELRTALGYTQVAFATKIGVSPSTASLWENNKKRPSAIAARRRLVHLAKRAHLGGRLSDAALDSILQNCHIIPNIEAGVVATDRRAHAA